MSPSPSALLIGQAYFNMIPGSWDAKEISPAKSFWHFVLIQPLKRTSETGIATMMANEYKQIGIIACPRGSLGWGC